MPAGMVRPRASQVPPLRGVVIVQYRDHGWRTSEGGRIDTGGHVGPCAACHEPCVRYGPRGGPLCETCRHPGRRLPVPARITMALDANELYGPEVDQACGVEEPAVDRWEAGTLIPTPEQIVALAALTRQPPEFFYEPIEPGERHTRSFICDRSKRKHGLTIVESRIDEHDVLHYEVTGGPPR